MTESFNIDLQGISLSDIDSFDVDVLDVVDSVGVPETGASTYIHSCSCSYQGPQPD